MYFLRAHEKCQDQTWPTFYGHQAHALLNQWVSLVAMPLILQMVRFSYTELHVAWRPMA